MPNREAVYGNYPLPDGPSRQCAVGRALMLCDAQPATDEQIAQAVGELIEERLPDDCDLAPWAPCAALLRARIAERAPSTFSLGRLIHRELPLDGAMTAALETKDPERLWQHITPALKKVLRLRKRKRKPSTNPKTKDFQRQ